MVLEEGIADACFVCVDNGAFGCELGAASGDIDGAAEAFGFCILCGIFGGVVDAEDEFGPGGLHFVVELCQKIRSLGEVGAGVDVVQEIQVIYLCLVVVDRRVEKQGFVVSVCFNQRGYRLLFVCCFRGACGLAAKGEQGNGQQGAESEAVVHTVGGIGVVFSGEDVLLLLIRRFSPCDLFPFLIFFSAVSGRFPLVSHSLSPEREKI